jgi:hypothetical protein
MSGASNIKYPFAMLKMIIRHVWARQEVQQKKTKTKMIGLHFISSLNYLQYRIECFFLAFCMGLGRFYGKNPYLEIRL